MEVQTKREAGFISNMADKANIKRDYRKVRCETNFDFQAKRDKIILRKEV